jgi:outer membrane protein TolC
MNHGRRFPGRRAAWAALLAAALTGSPLYAEEPVLDLAAALDAALAHNPAHGVRRLEVQKGEQIQRAARGASLPSVEFGASATHYGYPTFVYSIRTLAVLPPFDQTIYDYGVALRLPLYTGGRLGQGVALADLGREIAAERERLGAQELTFNTSSVYLNALHLARLEQAYATRIASLEAQERRVQLLVQVGRAPRLDALKISVLLGKARHDRLQITNRQREAVALLYNLMGRDPPVQTPSLTGYAPRTVPVGTLPELRAQALAARPELQIAEHEVQAGTARVGSARAERLPSLSLAGIYHERAGADNDTDWYDEWNVGVQLTLPLMDGGVRRHRVEEAQLAAEQARQRREETRLTVERQAQDAWNAHAEAESRLDVTARSLAEAEEALGIEKLRYEQGIGLITDLLGAETALLTAQADRLQAEFDLITARLDLLRAGGNLEPARVLALVAAQPGQNNQEPQP